MRVTRLCFVFVAIALIAGVALAQSSPAAATDAAPGAQSAPAPAASAPAGQNAAPPAASAPAAEQAPAATASPSPVPSDAAAPTGAATTAPAAAAAAPPEPPRPALNVNQVIDRMIQRERAEVTAMTKYHPMVETYIQIVKHDDEMQTVPASDHYYLGRLDLSDGYHEKFFLDVEKTGFVAEVGKAFSPMRFLQHDLHRFWTIDYLPIGFAAMVFPDAQGFDKNKYTFQFLRREFLGDVKCLVFHVVPKDMKDRGAFLGRIWVEDHDYNIVRFNGVYVHQALITRYFHFDSWRNNVKPGLWLPSQIYSEESEAKAGILNKKVRFKCQTRLWAYDLKHSGRQEEFSEIEIEQDKQVSDESEKGTDFSPLMSLRAWERESEDNVVDRLEQAGLIAPPGPVDKMLEQIVTNVEAGNDLDIEPEVRCRVLLTAPLESASIGHTIVISRGLLDTLPTEASVAMILTHELGHIARGEQIDTKYSFGDRMQFNDNVAYQRFPFKRTEEQEDEADKKALELLKKSIYGDKLKEAGLYLRQLQERAPDITHLTEAHLGNGLTVKNTVTRMAVLMNGAPELKPRDLSQIPALPLGGRIKISAWDGKIELLKAKAVQPNFPSEKMPFEIAPAVMRLSRLSAPAMGAPVETPAGK
jgi:hypothetical protein